MVQATQASTMLDSTQTVPDGNKMPETVPQSIKELVLPAEQLSLTSFLDHRLPPCATSASDLENYFTTLLPDTTTVSESTITDELRTLPSPPPSVVHQLSLKAPIAWTNGSRSIVYMHTDNPRRFSFWILPLWRTIVELRTNQFEWRAARQSVSQLASSHSEAMAFRAHMDVLTWSGTFQIESLKDWTPIKDLCQFASRDWMSGSNLNAMLDVMYKQVKAADPTVEHKFKIQNTYFCARLRSAHSSHLRGQTSPGSLSFLQNVGTLLVDNPHSICFLAHVHGNHWTSVAIDAITQQIHYGDSNQGSVPDDLKNATEWWLSNHFTSAFTWMQLCITPQSDLHSCGLLAANALMHYVSPDIHPLLPSCSTGIDLDVARLHWGNAIISTYVRNTLYA